MPANAKRYAADDAQPRRRPLAPGEEDAIALFLAKTDHLLAAVIASLVVCICTIAFGQ